MSNQIAYEPKIRFQGFKDQWKFVNLGDYLEQYNEVSTQNNQYPVLTSSRKGIFFQRNYYSNGEVASGDNTGYNVVPRGYFTYRHMSDDLIFKFNINDICDKGIVSTLYPVFTTKKGISDEYLKLVLNNGKDFKRYALIQKQGGSRTYMYYSRLIKLKIRLPHIDEQLKISSYFDRIDSWINNLQNQKEKLDEFRKAILQKIFSEKLHFKNCCGECFPKWQMLSVGDLIDEFNQKSTENNQLPVFTSSREGIMLQSDYYGGVNRITDRDNTGFNIIPEGYITYRSRSDDGIFHFNVNDTNQAGLISVYYPVFKSKAGNNYFLALALNNSWKTLYKYSVGTSQKVLSFNELKKIKLRMPCEQEQEKIVCMVKDIDLLITMKNKEIKLAQRWKKASIQQMIV